MHFHLPKPLHGWREFVGEVGIIVIGVLIALGAEQLVEGWQWRNKVHETTKQLNAELYRDARAAYAGLVVGPCLDQQLGAIDAALATARQTGRVQATVPFTPPLHVFTEDTWLNARGLEVADHLSAGQIRTYSRLFFFPRDLGGSVVELHKEGAELRPLARGIAPVSTEEVGDYQRKVGRIHELVDRVELGETLLLRELKPEGIELARVEKSEALQAESKWAGKCVSPPDLNRQFAKGD